MVVEAEEYSQDAEDAAMIEEVQGLMTQMDVEDDIPEKAEEESDQPAKEEEPFSLDGPEPEADKDDAVVEPEEEEAEADPDPEEPAVELEVDDDVEIEGDGLVPDLRRKLQAANKENKRLSRESTESATRREAADKHAAAASLVKPVADSVAERSREYTTRQLLEYAGETEHGGNDGKFRKQALEYLEYKDPREIAQVVREARDGAFGEASRDIELVATDQLSMVQSVHAERQAEVQGQQAWTDQYARCMDQVRESDVAFLSDGQLDMTNEATVGYVTSGQELLAVLPSLANEANAPSVVLQFRDLKIKAAKADTVPALEARIKELEAKLTKQTAPLPRSDAGSKGADGSTAQEKLDAQFEREVAASGVFPD